MRGVGTPRSRKRRLRGLGELERECVGAVQYPHAADLERAHVRERVGHGASVPAHIGRWARLVEVKRRERRIHVRERGFLEVDRGVAHAAALERLEERLLPVGVLEKDGEFRTLGSHDRHVGAKVAGCK
jgi:hypothetical protein